MVTKIMAICILVVSVSFSVFLFSMNAQAQEQWVCCVKEGQCEDYTLRSECLAQGGRAFAKACSEVHECKVGTCIPKIATVSIHEALVANCQYNKPRLECEAQLGGWSPGIPDLCKKGCCQIPHTVVGRVCANLPLFVCKEVARRNGGNYTFKEGTSDDECYNICGAEKLGCCVLGGGECKYQTRGECKGTFYDGLYCYQVGSPQCIVERHASEGCCSPLTVSGGEIKRAICSFDSAGNQEETLRECSYPEAKCEICNKESCKDINGSSVDFGKPYCKDRSCYLEGGEGSQKVKEIGKQRIEFEKVDAPTKLLHGQSVCYNFFSHQGGLDLNGKQTGLQSQILRCVEGNLSIDGLGVDREELCVQTSPVSVKTIQNNWEQCRNCAAKGGFWNAIKDSFLAVPSFPGLLRLSPDYCGEKTCSELGKVKVDGIIVHTCWYNYDNNWPNEGKGIGSCDPVYPPGTTTMCKQCGGGGDWMYNVCDEAECYSLGNCQFESLKWYSWQSITHFMSRAVPAFMAMRISLVPAYDCPLEASARCRSNCTAAAVAYPGCMAACMPPSYAACLVDRTKYVNPLCWVASLVGPATSSEAAKKFMGGLSIVSGFIPGMPWYARAGLELYGFWAVRGGEEKKTETK